MANKNKKANVQGTEATVENTVENANVVSIEGLESATPTASTNIDYSSREYLENNEPVIVPEFASSKHNEERETKVQSGLAAIVALAGDKINPLLILLGKWWEVKPARAAIKAMIDAEAEALGKHKDVYLQNELRPSIENIGDVKAGVERLLYATNYFKPRNGIKAAFKQIKIDGDLYSVNIEDATKAKEQFGTDVESIKAYLIERSTKIEIEEYI